MAEPVEAPFPSVEARDPQAKSKAYSSLLMPIFIVAPKVPNLYNPVQGIRLKTDDAVQG